jgi:hypothetical protein
VLNRRRQIAGLFTSGSWLHSQTGRVFSGLGLAAASPQVADAARPSERRADKQERNDDDASNNRDKSEGSKQSETASDQRNDDKANAETRDSGAKSDNSGKRVRDESTNENDESRETRATDDGKTRGESRRNSDSDSSETSAEDQGSLEHTGRRSRGFEQRAEDEPLDDVPDAITVTPANPNVVADGIPSSPIADLVVDANEDVLASVSTSGGFAFARSGDVIAVSGPDGASIIQTGDESTDTIDTSPVEPLDDGGNNDVDFVS